MKGIDISSWQAGIDLEKLGIDFAILKISEGKTWVDPQFDTFYTAAKVPVGAYVFSHATTIQDAEQEAQKALSLLNGRHCPLGVYMDVEAAEQLMLSDNQLTDVVNAFCNVIRAGGYIAGVYGSEGNLWQKVKPSALDSGTLIWVAKWSSMRPSMPCDIWQYTDQARLDFYSGNLDGDEAVSDRFIALVCGNAPATSGETETPVESPYFTLTIPALQHGDVGDAVKALQGELIASGYRCGGKIVNGAEKADGIFGNVTREAVASFQRAHNIVDTGIADKLTRAALLGL